MLGLTFFVLFASLAVAAPAERGRGGSPKARITPATANGSTVTITGVAGSGVDVFHGIPFAESPIGDLRFARPQPKVYDAHLSATVPPPACLQYTDGISSSPGYYGISEDCLTLNVMVPAGHVGCDSGLPVMVWIYGGGFYGGAGSKFLSPNLVRYGARTDRPFILVTFNYRLSIFGWGYGKEIADNGAANLGLRDQIAALEWIQENIAAFGGDPNKVTVFGQSAGAVSIGLLMLNETTDLFRGAILMSGAQASLPLGPTDAIWQAPYDGVVAEAGCNGTYTSSFECLKALPADKLLNATLAYKWDLPQSYQPYFWGPSIDGDLITDSPQRLIAQGKFARIPFISGNVKDEGTDLVNPKNVTLRADQDIAGFLDNMYPVPPSDDVVAQIVQHYPNDPALGCPFDTGNNTFGFEPVYKQASAIANDAMFVSRRRWFQRQANMHGFNKTWAYEWQGFTPHPSSYVGSTYGNANQTGMAPRAAGPDIDKAYKGITHSADIPFVFGVITRETNYTAGPIALSEAMMNYWINFVHHLDPNGVNIPDSGCDDSMAMNTTYWHPHTFPANKNSLLMLPDKMEMFQDTFREDGNALFNQEEIAMALNLKRRGMLPPGAY